MRMSPSKSKILRQAILGSYSSSQNIPEKITINDVTAKWPFLKSTGLTAYTVLQYANTEDESQLSDSLMTIFMDSLNVYNEYHS